jgi:hypothetical protein
MKKLIFSAFFLVIIVGANGQNLDTENLKKNEIDLVLTDVIDGAFQLRYERLVAEHWSVGLGLGYKGENGLISLRGIDTESITIDEISYSGFKIIPEVRYYFNNNGHAAMKGFYLGAYLKYSQYQSNIDGTYTNDALENFDVEFDADIKVTSIGLMAGYKLPITDKFSIDFLIAGPGRGSYNISIENKKDLPDEFYDDLNEALEDYPIFDMLDGDFRFSALNRRSRLNLLSLRYGISLGYSF